MALLMLTKEIKDLDVVMPMCNLVEYSANYLMAWESLRNYYIDEVNDAANENNVDNFRINNNKTATNKSFECKEKITGGTPADSSKLEKEVFAPLEYLSNFCRFLNLPLINCEIEFDLS